MTQNKSFIGVNKQDNTKNNSIKSKNVNLKYNKRENCKSKNCNKFKQSLKRMLWLQNLLGMMQIIEFKPK